MESLDVSHLPQVPLARPRIGAREQLERIRRNQEYGRPLLAQPPPGSSPWEALSPTRRQPDAEQKVRKQGGSVRRHSGFSVPGWSLSFPLCKMGFFPSSISGLLVPVFNSASCLPYQWRTGWARSNISILTSILTPLGGVGF